MEFSIKLHTKKSEWSGVKGYNFQNNIAFFSLKMDFVLHDEMPHDAAFHLGLRCLQKYPFKSYWSLIG